jgi:hypothetical protein
MTHVREVLESEGSACNMSERVAISTEKLTKYYGKSRG